MAEFGNRFSLRINRFNQVEELVSKVKNLKTLELSDSTKRESKFALEGTLENQLPPSSIQLLGITGNGGE